MANYVKEICKTLDLIVKEISLNQYKISKINLLGNYYLPVLIKMLPQIQRAFRGLLNRLFDDENNDIGVCFVKARK